MVFGLPRISFGSLNRLSTLGHLETRFTDASANVTVTMFRVKEYGAQNHPKAKNGELHTRIIVWLSRGSGIIVTGISLIRLSRIV